jgi:hypothetical protein
VAVVLDLSEPKRAEEAPRELASDFAHMNRLSPAALNAPLRWQGPVFRTTGGVKLINRDEISLPGELPLIDMRVDCSDGDPHVLCRDGRPLPKNLGQLLLQICIAASGFGRFAGFGLVHRRYSPIYVAAGDGIAPGSTRVGLEPEPEKIRPESGSGQELRSSAVVKRWFQYKPDRDRLFNKFWRAWVL